MDQLERVTNLLALLLETRVPLTLEEIANELTGQYPDNPVARRAAFERDKALLRGEGVPIEQHVLGGERAGQTAYRVDRRRFELADLGLDDEERRALQLAVAALHLGASWGEEAMWKLERADDPPDGGLVAVAASLPAPPALPELFQGVTERREVTFDYRSRTRRLQPYGLLAREGFWYVVGHDLDAGAVRSYRVDRIERDRVCLGDAGSFEPPTGFRPADAFPIDPKLLGATGDESGEVMSAVVLVDAPRARGAAAEVGESSVLERRPDGSVVVSVPCANREAFRSWLLGFLEHAEVLSPADVRDEVIAWLRTVTGEAST